MRISELSTTSGVSVPTIKYYLREGLLHPGAARSTNQADYDDGHVRRLRLIRALIDVGGLTIAQVVQTLAAVDDPTIMLHDAFGIAQDALSSAQASGSDSISTELAAARSDIERWLRRRRWRVRPDAAAILELAETLLALNQFGWSGSTALFDGYADYAFELAEFEVAHVTADVDRAAMMEHTVVGTVAFERAYGAIRRLALEHHSQKRFGRRRTLRVTQKAV